MRYYYQHEQLGSVGPYTAEELRTLHLHGVVRPETPISLEQGGPEVLFKELWSQLEQEVASSGATRPGFVAPSALPMAVQDSFTRRAGEDLRMLSPHLLLPLEELRSFRWLENRKALSIAGIGLLPLVIYAGFGGGQQIGNAFWAMALYFSMLWALFFYYVFPAREVRFSAASFSFFATGLLSLVILLHLYRSWPLSELLTWTRPSQGFTTRWLGFVLGVGFPEELCKALVLLFLAARFGPFAPQAMLFYGLMAGLGFGIYEGVSYQMQHNFRFADGGYAYRDRTSYAAEYYLLNMIRLTTLPFLHAIWTGMAGYFIGFAAQYPQRRRGLLIVALGLPALLHGSYNAFSGSALGLVTALLSVLALNLYLAKSVDFERLLAARRLG